jgi:hypothetical protein
MTSTPSDAVPSTPMTTGGYVQYNKTTQSPLAGMPDAAEESIGIVRQLFTAAGQKYAQVIWNPGSARPETGLYTEDELCPISQKQAVDLVNQMNEGDYQPPSGIASSNYQQPSVPTLALPPALQGASLTPTQAGPIDQSLSPGEGYS